MSNSACLLKKIAEEIGEVVKPAVPEIAGGTSIVVQRTGAEHAI